MDKRTRGFEQALKITQVPNSEKREYSNWRIYKRPARTSTNSGKYILYLSEDVTVPSTGKQMIGRGMTKIGNKWLGSLSELNKEADEGKKICGCSPTVLHTGIKAYMREDEYLKVTLGITDIRHAGLVLVNGEKTYCNDDYSNSKDDGEICIEVYNLTPWDITLKHGEPICYAVFQSILKADQDVVLM